MGIRVGARVVCHCAYRDEVSRCTGINGPLTNAVVEKRYIDAERTFGAHYEHLENDTLLPLTHAPALISCTIRARPPLDVISHY